MSENKTTSKKEETQDKNPENASAAAKKTAAASTAKAKTAEELKAEEEAKKKAAAEAAKKEAEQAKIKAAQGESSYVAAPKERHLYHVKLDKPAYSPKDGKKLSKAFIQKFTVQDWKNHLAHAKGLGFTAEVLWNPEEYAKA